VQKKQDTSKGFDPTLSIDDSMRSPNRECFRIDGRLDEAVLSPALHRLILGMARIRNVVSSLLIEGEGIDFTRARQILESRSPTSPTEKQTLRFLDKYQWIHDTPAGDLPDLTPKFLRELHGELFVGMDGYGPGQFKAEPNGIRDETTGRITFVCTPPERTKAELDALYAWYKDARQLQIEAVVAGTWFAEFEAIHPFRDGNGRVGRLVSLIILKKLGLQNAPLVPLDARFYRTRDKYYEKLAATNTGKNWHVWNRYFAKELAKSYRHAMNMADLRPILEHQKSKPTRATLEWVLGRAGADWFKRGDLPNGEGFSGVALTKALADLTGQGVLEPRGEKRGRQYRLRTEYLEQIFAGISEE
jgi:Fic family protein